MDQKAKIDTVFVAFSVKKLNELKHGHVENYVIFKDSDRPKDFKNHDIIKRDGGLHNSSMPMNSTWCNIFRY